MDYRVRLYESALNGVQYVYGAPVQFIPRKGLTKRRERHRERKVANLVAMAEAREQAALKKAAKDGGTKV